MVISAEAPAEPGELVAEARLASKVPGGGGGG
jgi:hypothetical protein